VDGGAGSEGGRGGGEAGREADVDEGQQRGPCLLPVGSGREVQPQTCTGRRSVINDTEREVEVAFCTIKHIYTEWKREAFSQAFELQ
jgi:hypothetical protein